MNANDAMQTIAELDLEQIKLKLMHKQSGEGWSATRADATEAEYRRFLCLVLLHPEECFAPLVDVDTFWHYHILDTRKYAADCQQAFGYFLHHNPAVGLDGDAAGGAEHEALGARMQTLYQAAFGGAAQQDGRQAWCSAATAWCSAAQSAAAAQQASAWCSLVSAPRADATAWCSLVSAPQADAAAWCSIVSATKADATAWCSIAAAKPADATAWCSVASAKPAAATAWCSVASAKPAGATAWCSIAAAKPARSTAWCSIAGTAAGQATAWCSITARSAADADKAAWCSVAGRLVSISGQTQQLAWCSVSKPAGRAVRTEALLAA
jgi:hypothetical protein